MIGFALKLLSGPAGIWILIGTLVGIFAFGVTTGTTATILVMRGNVAVAEKQTAQCEALRQTARADASEKANGELVKSIKNALDADALTRQGDLARSAKAASLLEKLSHVQVTKACVDSPAIRAYVDSLR